MLNSHAWFLLGFYFYTPPPLLTLNYTAQSLLVVLSVQRMWMLLRAEGTGSLASRHTHTPVTRMAHPQGQRRRRRGSCLTPTAAWLAFASDWSRALRAAACLAGRARWKGCRQKRVDGRPLGCAELLSAPGGAVAAALSSSTVRGLAVGLGSVSLASEEEDGDEDSGALLRFSCVMASHLLEGRLRFSRKALV